MILSRTSTCLRPRKAFTIRSRAKVAVQRRPVTTHHGLNDVKGDVQSSTASLATITDDLDQIAPRFDIDGDDIEVIESPADFYTALKHKIAGAQRRIFLSTLYVGKSEAELIGTLQEALQRQSQLKVSILTDALRGTREAPKPSCASLLTPLVEEFGPQRVEIRMFHTPNLVGLKKSMLPKRINEGWGLQHMKLYGIDDEIIMSGANLSEDYFTNRQDRYHVFKSAMVTDYFAEVHNAVCQLSYNVVPEKEAESGFALSWPSNNVQPAPLVDAEAYRQAATDALRPLFAKTKARLASATATDTVVYPLLQLTPLLKPDTSTELPAITKVLQRLATPQFAGSRWTFTAGYFNMTPDVRKLLLDSNPSSATVIGASPWANGFYGSKGVSGMLPAAYTLLSRRFVEAVAKQGMSDRVQVKEWRKGTVNTPGGWTYHAKGIWITLPGQQNPSVNLVGSSNYTKRSYSLDLEANALVVTSNPKLQQRYGEEVEHLQKHATPMQLIDFTKTERRVGLHVRLAMWIVTLVGGAL
ncbi:hypothetical protein AMS68_004095 [Peltaster fructicola]|uniref:CDP-diacylglycerol--glycerol-3-phosphate 3-phosphatidyltransferase n=1 Tax=Peltaster fructicola TaxID=286661 RepID=A0A6H0XVE5_9PEZI|nr:hypothetical protein AMS68_004095 [Peltaster fructicola]